MINQRTLFTLIGIKIAHEKSRSNIGFCDFADIQKKRQKRRTFNHNDRDTLTTQIHTYI